MSNEKAKSAAPSKLFVTAGEYLGQSFAFAKSEIVIGRGPENDIVLVNDPKISRVHCKILVGLSEASIENLSQKNQIFVNGLPVQTEKLANEAIIKIGDSQLKFTAEFKSVAIAEPYVPPKPPVVSAPISQVPQPNENSSVNIPVQKMPSSIPKVGAPAGVPAPRAPMQQPGVGVPATGFPPAQNFPAQRAPGMPQPFNPAMAGGFGQPMANPGYPPARTAYRPPEQNGRLKFYGGIIVLGIIGYFAFFANDAKKGGPGKESPPVRTEAFVARDIATVEKRLRDFEVEQAGEQTDRNQRIKENLQRGLRDLQQGNYLRSQESFQVVMNLDAENLLARRYFQVSKVRFDEQVKALMLQAKKYKEKYNYRMCAANYKSVENLLQNKKDSSTLREAVNGRKVCQVCQERGSDLCRDSK